MILPKINVYPVASGIEIADLTIEDNVAGSTNYSSGILNTNYTRGELDSVAIQVIIGKDYKNLIVKVDDVSNVYSVTLAELGLTVFQDAPYNVIYTLLFNEGSGTATVTTNQTNVFLSVDTDKVLLLQNRVILISGQLYDIDIAAISSATSIELLLPYTGVSGTFAFKHGYRQNDEFLHIEGIRACVTKKIANIGCTCSKSTDVEELYMNYKAIISNFELGNFGKTVDLISFANTICSNPKIKNCACSC